MKYYLTQVFCLWSVIVLAAGGKNKKPLKAIENKLDTIVDALARLQNQTEDINEKLGGNEIFNGTVGAVESNETVQLWVFTVTGFSSQYNNNSWSAAQVIGEPDVYPEYGDIRGTWAQKDIDANQYIELEFAEALHITGIGIYETYHAGGVKEISGKGQNSTSTWQTLWSTDQVEVITNSRIFSPSLQIPHFPVKYVRLDVDCTASQSWVEIDAVQLKGTRPISNE